MAKAKKTTAKASKKVTPAKSNAKEITINLDTFATPIAIVVAGIIIALMIFITNKSNNNTVDNDSKGANPTVGNAPEVPKGEDVTVTLGDDPYVGDKSKAKVAVVEFSDYQCGYCKRHSDETYPDIKKNYVDTGKAIYVFKEFPLGDSGLGYDTAMAGACVFEQVGREKFAEFHSGAMGLASAAEVRAKAIAVGADGAKFDSCVSSKKFKDEIAADKAEGSKAGISGTPGFIVGKLDKDGNITGPLVAGAYPYETFKSAIEELLK